MKTSRSTLTFASVITAALSVAASAEALDLRLRCDGVATYPEMQSSSVFVSGDANLTASSSRVVAGAKPDRLLVEVANDEVRVRLPRVIVPPLNSGGKDGWWPLTDVSITDSEIGGRFRLNPLNKPTVRIDRGSGAIEVQGSFKLSFRGECSVADPTERRF